MRSGGQQRPGGTLHIAGRVHFRLVGVEEVERQMTLGVDPRAEREGAVVFVERKLLGVDGARAAVDERRLPQHRAVVRDPDTALRHGHIANASVRKFEKLTSTLPKRRFVRLIIVVAKRNVQRELRLLQ